MRSQQKGTPRTNMVGHGVRDDGCYLIDKREASSQHRNDLEGGIGAAPGRCMSAAHDCCEVRCGPHTVGWCGLHKRWRHENLRSPVLRV